MADRLIRGLTVRIGADTSKLGTAMRDAENEVKKARAELKEINSDLRSNGESAELWRQKQAVLTDAIKASENKLKDLQTAQKSISDQLRDGDIDKAAYDRFQDKLTKARNKLSDLKKQQEDVEQQFKKGEIDRDAYTKFTDKVHRAEAQVKDLETAEHSLEENFRLGNISEEQYRAFRREVERTESDIKYFSGQLDNAKSHLDKLGGEADETGGEMSDFGEKAEDAGNKADGAARGGISAMTVALGNLAADGIRLAARELKDFTKDVVVTGMEFGAAMSAVGAVSGASESELEELTAKAEEMGATTKFTASEAAEAFNYMAMAGWKTEDMLSGIEGILSLAAASGTDLATTSDIVTDAMTAFGLGAKDAGHFADVLAAASSNANTNVSMMGETFKYAAPVAGALGFSIEDTAEAIGLMANSGIKSSQAGTALRAVLTALSDDLVLTGKAFAEAGAENGEFTITTSDGEGKMRALGDILTELRTKWELLSEKEQSANAEAIAGKNAMSGFLALMNAAPEDVEKLSGAIEECDGAAQGMADTMQDNLQGDVTLMKSAIDGMKISLSEKLEPALRSGVQYITKNMPQIEAFLGKAFDVGGKLVKGAVDYLPKIVQTGKDLLPVITGIGTAVGALKSAEKVKNLTALFTGLSGAAGLASAGIGGVAAALIVGGVSYVYAAEKAREAHLDEVYREATAEADALAKGVNDDIAKMNKLSQTAQEQVRVDFADIYRTENLWNELQTLVDENGKVKKGYEDRVQYITSELSGATGTEIELVDGVIQKYDELKETIDKVIEKKRASAFASAYSDMYEEALKQQAGAAEEIISIEDAIAQNEAKLRSYNKQLSDTLPKWIYSKGVEQFGELDKLNYWQWTDYIEQAQLDNAADADKYTREGLSAAAELISDIKGAGDSFQENRASLRNAKLEARRDSNTIENYETGLEMIGEEKYRAAQRYFAKIDNMSNESLNNQTKNQEEALKNFEDMVDQAQRIYKTETDLGIKGAKEKFEGSAEEAFRYLTEECGISMEDAKNIAVTKLSEIDHFDTEGLLAFCRAVGVSLVEVMGDSASSALSERLSQIQGMVDSFAESSNSAFRFIGGHMQSFAHKLGFFADGGFLSSGQGIVAEAGPELLEVMNGGVRITPLTSTAKNTPVSGQSPTVINNYYQEIKAAVSNDYDIYRLAERLSLAQKILDKGRGIL